MLWFIATVFEIDPIPWDTFPYLKLFNIEIMSTSMNKRIIQSVQVCACVWLLYQQKNFLGLIFTHVNIHPFQIQWCMSTNLKNYQHNTPPHTHTHASGSVPWLIEIKKKNIKGKNEIPMMMMLLVLVRKFCQSMSHRENVNARKIYAFK